jgi:hypothetical protein
LLGTLFIELALSSYRYCHFFLPISGCSLWYFLVAATP